MCNFQPLSLPDLPELPALGLPSVVIAIPITLPAFDPSLSLPALSLPDLPALPSLGLPSVTLSIPLPALPCPLD
jgi:hypothetical protein